jgi:hypothetical protein
MEIVGDNVGEGDEQKERTEDVEWDTWELREPRKTERGHDRKLNYLWDNPGGIF